jgi:hypothetical protein
MRCPSHPALLATSCCIICSAWLCDVCAPIVDELGGPVCPQCRPGVDSLAAEPSTSPRPRSFSRLAIAALLVLVTALAVGYPQLVPGGGSQPGDLRRAYRQLESVGMALERFRAERGHYPTSLSELVPGQLRRVPRDPFARGREELKYLAMESAGQRRLLYSVGPDGEDQQGQSLDPLSGRGDIVYPVD